MARLGWIRQISCLFAILLSIWTLGTEAHLIDRSSCINLREYDFQGRIHSWGNVLSQLTTSLDETADMATIAYNTMRAVADRSGSRFDKKRTKNMFIALQGDSGELRIARIYIADCVTDPILRAAGMTEMNSWWTPNVAACAESGSTATNVLNTYIIVCAGAFQETGLTIGSERTTHPFRKAYGYSGATELLRRFPDRVPTNDDNLGILMLGK
ncbi:hypothetical protein N7510_010423 [Penicillium lagena]|uniref:uncharacterized protein n=1 Tax=Penicillium lagena TaxID=94218 RepID=UPI002541489D|nr:uncharacterized protein N7510_010423 [Penicillium lagena]KAJ5605269.1 hypothetical protein N7510_010423 [Penicillium lagena]